ncbi:MAG: TonB-dependent receptor [Prevotella sp.]|jgi:TonB-linked SusC/RagA family outer membrane protein|nr:TonB-dependent receptor [Prevotella sp.]
MGLNLFKVNRKFLAILLLCSGSFVGGPLPTLADNNEKDSQITHQQIQITGVVRDTNGDPIIGASISEKGTTNGTLTDAEGRFTLSVLANATLRVSYLGFVTREIEAVSGKTLDVILEEDAKLLDEVVVVGFGTQKKVNLTGAVGVLSGNDIMERPVANATQALQGLVPGLNISVTSGSLESRPGINVRGTTTIGEGTSGSPLILIDGMEGELHSINPQDIASISVLKDAAASSIYGSRAPFGVILITTKSGNTDGKTTINYNNSFRSSSPINKKHMMNSVQFASWVNDALTNQGQGVRFNESYMERLITWQNAKPYAPGQRITADGTIVYALEAQSSGQWNGGFSTGADDVDYYDEVYKNHNFSQEHNISASGGTKKFNYYASGSFYTNDGLIKLGNENLDRFTATAKISSELTNWLKLNMNMRFTREDYERPSQLTDWFYESLAYKGWPILPLYDRNGNFFYSDDTSVAGLAEGGKDKKQTDFVYIQSGFVLEPVKNWLTYIDFNYRIKSANRHWDSYPKINHDINGNPYYRNSSSNVHEDLLKENYYNFNARTEYSLSLNKSHNFHVMAGVQAENLKQTLFGLQRNGIMINSKPEIDLTSGLDINGNPITPSVNGGRNEWSTAGFFGRINYDYQGKYLLELNLRADGSSRFRKGNQWKTFPSASVGWNIAQESFFEPLQQSIDMLKIRASYGSLGNQNTDNWYYTYQTLSASPSSGGWLQNGIKPNVAYAPGLVSESLTWETIESYNLGLDWALFKNRLSGSFDYFVRNTIDMVGAAPALPDILGTDVPKTNNTDLRTNGWEFSIMWRDVMRNGLSYSAKFLLSDSQTKITRYPNNPTQSINTYIEGRYINEIWGYETIGLAGTDEEMQQHLATLTNGGQNAFGSNWTAGDIMYKDLNDDGKISGGSGTLSDPGDRKVIGNSTPRYNFGIDLNAAWKGFDMRIFFQGVMKRDYWQSTSYMYGFTSGGLWGAAGLTSVGDYFRNDDSWSVREGYNTANINAYLPRPLESDKNLQVQTRYLQDASYIRLKNLQIGYTLPTSMTSKWGMQKVRVYVSGENLWTGTKLVEQFDPETIGTNKGNGYPLSCTLSGGLSLTF